MKNLLSVSWVLAVHSKIVRFKETFDHLWGLQKNRSFSSNRLESCSEHVRVSPLGSQEKGSAEAVKKEREMSHPS